MSSAVLTSQLGKHSIFCCDCRSSYPLQGKSTLRASCVCHCGNYISNKDPHEVCSNCLELENTRQAIDNPGSWRFCHFFTVKSLRRQLMHQVSLSGADPYLTPTTPGDDEQLWSDTVAPAPSAKVSWGSRLALGTGTPAPVLDLDDDYEDDDASDFLVSEEDDDSEDFSSLATAVQPVALAVSLSDRCGTPATPTPTLDMLDLCK